MIRIEWRTSQALPALHAIQDPRLEAKCAKAAAERYTESILDWIAAGNSFTSRNGSAGLEGSIDWRPDGDGAVVYANKEYAPYVEQGTGLYGPHQTPVVPKRAKALQIPLPGGAFMYRRQVKGMPAKPYFFADFDARQESMLDAVRSIYADVLGGPL